MTKEEISKAIVECEERIEECEMKLKHLREELNKPSYGGKRWKPKMGEEYFYVNVCGVVFTDNWRGEDDEEMYTFGNVYPTCKAAEFEVERRRVIAELSDYAEGNDAVWDDNTKHWTIGWDNNMKALMVDYHVYLKFAVVYFSSKEAARAALEAVGEERVKKFYLGVQE